MDDDARIACDLFIKWDATAILSKPSLAHIINSIKLLNQSYLKMLNRLVYLRTLRPMQSMRPMCQLRKQTRLYATVGGDDPAEFRAKKTARDNTTMMSVDSDFVYMCPVLYDSPFH
jgi:hypothetical protein